MTKTTILRNTLLTSLLAAVLAAPTAHAHGTTAYTDEAELSYTNADWMARVDNDTRLSMLSIPGTHDTMSYGYESDEFYDYVVTQSLDLTTQLEAGVRVLDIRAQLDYDNGGDQEIQINHGVMDVNSTFEEVMVTVNDFLAKHSGETVLIRFKNECSDCDDYESEYLTEAYEATGVYPNHPGVADVANRIAFKDKFEHHLDPSGLDLGGRVWRASTPCQGDENPTLGELRGKVVIMDSYQLETELIPGFGDNLGSDYACMQYDDSNGTLNIQDEYEVDGPLGIQEKWDQIRDHLETTDSGSHNGIYINYLSANDFGSVPPYRVSSGHSNWGWDANNLGTWVTFCNHSEVEAAYPDFSVSYSWPDCLVILEGTNVLTMDYIENGNLDRVGIVMSDFPGAGLLEAIINTNSLAEETLTWTPVSGALTQVAVGDGEVWGVNDENKVYRHNGAGWTNVPGSLTQVSVGAGQVWGVNANNQIYYRDFGDTGWTSVSGILKQVSIGPDGDVWGVNPAGQVYQRVGDGWVNVSGTLAQVSVGPQGEVWGLNSSGQVYRYNGDNTWALQPGSLAQISVAPDGEVWGVDAQNQIYRYNDTTPRTRTLISGVLNHVSIGDDGQVWGINPNDEIFRATDGS